MSSKVYDDLGCLLLFNNISEEDMGLLIDSLQNEKYGFIALLREVIDDDKVLLELLDVLSGQRVQFPPRRKVYKTLERISIYTFCKKRDFTYDSYRLASKQFGKRIPQIKAIIETMRKYVDSEEGNSEI